MRAMDVETAIRTRRTHKAYETEPVPSEVVTELLELARWAPNHHLTEPWRFRVLGPESFERLVAAGGSNEREKLGRAPTLVVASATQTGDAQQDREDVLATACAVYIVLLAAHARGLASYWRTPPLLQSAGRPGRNRLARRRGVRRPDPPRSSRVTAGRPRSASPPPSTSSSCPRAARVPSGTRWRREAGAAGRKGPPARDARAMRARGVEPPRAEAHRDLNPARLPVPPHPRDPKRNALHPRPRRRPRGPAAAPVLPPRPPPGPLQRRAPCSRGAPPT